MTMNQRGTSRSHLYYRSLHCFQSTGSGLAHGFQSLGAFCHRLVLIYARHATWSSKSVRNARVYVSLVLCSCASRGIRLLLLLVSTVDSTHCHFTINCACQQDVKPKRPKRSSFVFVVLSLVFLVLPGVGSISLSRTLLFVPSHSVCFPSCFGDNCDGKNHNNSSKPGKNGAGGGDG